jgi:hypothetical protein
MNKLARRLHYYFKRVATSQHEAPIIPLHSGKVGLLSEFGFLCHYLCGEQKLKILLQLL